MVDVSSSFNISFLLPGFGPGNSEIYRGQWANILHDRSMHTCIRISRESLQTRTEIIEMKKEYDFLSLVTLKGRNLNCGLFGTQCGDFPTTLVQKGRSSSPCKGVPLCNQAYKCDLFDMVNSNGTQECHHKCFCRGPDSVSCRKVILFLGNGSILQESSHLEVCEMQIEVYSSIEARMLGFIEP